MTLQLLPGDRPRDAFVRVTIGASARPVRANFYPPPSVSSEVPAVVLLHGWAWCDDDPAHDLRGYVRAFSQAGFAVLVPSLRGWAPQAGPDDCVSAQLDDVRLTLEWLAERPLIDSRRLFLMGYSQGGQIALLAAARQAPIRALAAFAPVIDPATWGGRTDTPGLRGFAEPDSGGCAAWRMRNVLAVAGQLRQPVLLVHGEDDRCVPSEQSTALYARLSALRRPVRMVLLPGVGHALDAPFAPGLAISFFREQTTDARRCGEQQC